ncbi:amino acid ABC transporter permease [Agrococcus versicolor]|uniref:Amino acid ABC transporter permease n=1 Tax=Agrococcus versicolor TaxID=501482 RepID=A0ABP5MSD1_9MICO
MEILSRLFQNFFNWEYIAQVLPVMLTAGIWNTLFLTAVSGVLAVVLGVLLAVMGMSHSRWLRWPARIYTDVLRGIPAILLIVIMGQGLFWLARDVFGTTSPYPLGITALTLITAAYLGEIFRSGIQSVDVGQSDAARALGFSSGSTMLFVIIPQGIRRVLPATMNQLIQLIKLSSLVFYLGLQADQREIFRIAQDFASMSGNQSALTVAAVCYLIITVPLTHLVNFIDQRLRDGKRVVVQDDPLAETGALDQPTSTTTPTTGVKPAAKETVS